LKTNTWDYFVFEVYLCDIELRVIKKIGLPGKFFVTVLQEVILSTVDYKEHYYWNRGIQLWSASSGNTRVFYVIDRQ